MLKGTHVLGTRWKTNKTKPTDGTKILVTKISFGKQRAIEENRRPYGARFVSEALIRISGTNQLKHDRHWTSGEPGASGDVI